jgi:hypothetical protein
MGLVASLSDFSASQIFFLLAKFSKTGRVELRTPGEKGEVFFVKGNVTHAKCSKMKGVEALYNLSIFASGEVEFFPDDKSGEITIKDEVSSLIGEIERRKVELNEIQAKLPPFDTILIKSPNPPKDAVALRKDDWKILVLMDGKNDVKQTVEKSGLGALTVYKTITWLLEKGLIFDPRETERKLREQVGFLNALIKELASLGISEKEWVQQIKEIIEKSDSGPRLLDVLVTTGSVLSLKAKKSYDISKGEIEAVFGKVTKDLEEKCKAEFGPMLTKTKFAAAKKSRAK